jgi:hypothetical protein
MYEKIKSISLPPRLRKMKKYHAEAVPLEISIHI